MREILFRGKNFTNGEWEYGVPVFTGLNNELAFMKQMCSHDYQIIPETVGQYTGLTDKNGKKIFEGDIVKDSSDPSAHLLCDNGKKKRRCIGVVKFGMHEVPSDDPFSWGDAYGFYIEGDTIYPTIATYKPCGRHGQFEIEVIGNIHDNPELLKGGAE